MTVVFDGWLGGWSTEKTEKKKGVEIIYSRLGEKADEVIKRFVKEEGSGAIVITSDQEVSRFADRMAAAVISSEQFKDKIERPAVHVERSFEEEEEEARRTKKKGLSRRPSKKEKRARATLKKL
jgi:predicted RNA-binding protein with PIN domain